MNPFTAARLTPILTTLRQPQWIAALASVGFHGLLFAAGPSFSGLTMAALGNNSPDLEERRVPLIELTAEEQSRLPDFSASANSLFPSGDDDFFSLFPPSGSTFPTDPRAPGESLSVPSFQLPSRSFSSGLPPFPFPSQSSLSIPSRRSPSPAQPSIVLPPAPNTPPSDPNAAGPEDTPSANQPSTPASSSPSSNGSTTTDPGNASAPLNTGAQRASELLARVEFNGDQTSPAEVDIAKAAWLQTVQEKLGDTIAVAPDPLTLEIPYQGRLCLSPEPSDGLLGAVVTIAEEEGLTLWTAVLKSTGYPFLNQAAEQALRNLQQQPVEGSALEPNTSYQVIVKIDYDRQSCISREVLLQSRTSEADAPEKDAEETEDAEKPID
jgi:hypothetical protein